MPWDSDRKRYVFAMWLLFLTFFLDNTVRYMTDDKEKCFAERQNAENAFAATPTKLEIMLWFFKKLLLYHASLA